VLTSFYRFTEHFRWGIGGQPLPRPLNTAVLQNGKPVMVQLILCASNWYSPSAWHFRLENRFENL